MTIANCPSCTLDTGGNHEFGCPNNPIHKGLEDLVEATAVALSQKGGNKMASERTIVLNKKVLENQLNSALQESRADDALDLVRLARACGIEVTFE